VLGATGFMMVSFVAVVVGAAVGLVHMMRKL
jgi:hypothetical protein